jgi:hypothetical protein
VTALGKDSYTPPKLPEPYDGDIKLRGMLQRHAEAFDALRSTDPRVLDKAERLHRLADHLVQRDAQHLTVLMRKRQNTRGIPAVSYTPSSGRPPTVCEYCDGTGWRSSAPTKPCSACREGKRQGEASDAATADLRAIERAAMILDKLLTVILWSLSRGIEIQEHRAIETQLRIIEDSLAKDPPAERGSPALAYVLERENIRSAPDCPSCARINGFACPCRESVTGNGIKVVRSVCEFCERWAKAEPDESGPLNSKGKAMWPLPYLLKPHFENVRANLLAEDHTDRRADEAWVKSKRTKGAA